MEYLLTAAFVAVCVAYTAGSFGCWVGRVLARWYWGD